MPVKRLLGSAFSRTEWTRKRDCLHEQVHEHSWTELLCNTKIITCYCSCIVKFSFILIWATSFTESR
jgi:hypothetical protein